MKDTAQIVVVTPVKNEAWILDRFLAVTSEFADCIIIADQQSTDGSADICRKYPKVVLIDNASKEYDEAERQLLLLQKAREIIPDRKIILALDADEILAANAVDTFSWQSMLHAKPGTILYFEKPDLYFTTKRCIRYDVPWPIGYVDDGREHRPKKIHSIRIPQPANAEKMHVKDVKILHYALTRPRAQASKIRHYSIIENVLGTSRLLIRRISYAADKDHARNFRVEESILDWFIGWERKGIDMHSIVDKKYYWWDFEALTYFKKYGLSRFRFDDIWEFDWEACRIHAKALGISDIPDYKISPPSQVSLMSLRVVTKLFSFAREFKKSLK